MCVESDPRSYEATAGPPITKAGALDTKASDAAITLRATRPRTEPSHGEGRSSLTHVTLTDGPVTALGWLLRRIRGPQRTDYYGVAERTKRVPLPELSVAEAALSHGGPIAERLVRQLQEAPDVYRLREDDGTYELRISTKLELVRDVPRSGWMSGWIPVTTSPSGRRLELQVGAVWPGFAQILGRTEDGERWPKDWSVDPEDIVAVRAKSPWVVFPTAKELRQVRAEGSARVSAWLGEPDLLKGGIGRLEVEPPATSDQIRELEARAGLQVPEAYRTLLEAANGIQIGRLDVLGTADGYRLDMPGPSRLVIAPPNEDGALTLAATGEVVWVAYGAEATDGEIQARDLRVWVRQRLAGSRDIRRR